MSFGSEFGPAERLGAQQVTPEVQTDGLAPVDRHREKMWCLGFSGGLAGPRQAGEVVTSCIRAWLFSPGRKNPLLAAAVFRVQ